MKNTIYTALVILSGIILFSCNQSAKTETSDQASKLASETITDISQLTYRHVIKMVFDDEGEGLEWHGEEMPNEFAKFLTFTTGEACGEGDCGNRLFIKNSADKVMTVIVRGDYDLEGNQGYIPRKYVIDGGASIQIGCSHLCFGGKGYEIPRTIVESAFVSESE